MDDFILQAKVTDELSKRLKTFLTIYNDSNIKIISNESAEQ